MPLNDGTGPNGQGSRTGRGQGNCTGQGGVERPFGLGLGRGRRGGGRGRGLGTNANQGNSWIKNQLNELQAAIQKLTERLGDNK